MQQNAIARQNHSRASMNNGTQELNLPKIDKATNNSLQTKDRNAGAQIGFTRPSIGKTSTVVATH